MFSLFLKGFIIGLSIAAPVGPIGVLCINRTLRAGLMVGLLSGLGAALADAIYGCIAGFGLVAISEWLLGIQTPIRWVGGAFLIFLGIKTFLAPPQDVSAPDKANSLWQDFASTLVLTLTNPATIISFIAIYTSLGIVDHNASYKEALAIVLGVFLGSLAWWCVLCSGISVIRHKLSQTTLKRINHLSATILLAFGLFAFISGFTLKA